MNNERFLVEIIFNQAKMIVNDEGQNEYITKITTQIYSFEGSNRSSTLQDAKNFMDKVIRHGLELKGGSVIKSIIHPSCILQVGLVDQNVYEKELAAGMEDIQVDPSGDGPVGSSIPADTEPTPTTGVDLDEAG